MVFLIAFSTLLAITIFNRPPEAALAALWFIFPAIIWDSSWFQDGKERGKASRLLSVLVMGLVAILAFWLAPAIWASWGATLFMLSLWFALVIEISYTLSQKH
jgi:hypothetical protein